MTAVEWLIHQYIKDGLFKKGVYEQAKEMEKQQIIDAYNKSFELRDKPYSTADKYYTSTYASKGSDDHIVDTNEMVSSQTKRMYSQEEVYHILVEHTAFLFQGGKSTLTEWFEKYKK